MNETKTEKEGALVRKKLVPFSVWIEEETERLLNDVAIDGSARPAVQARIYIKYMLQPGHELIRQEALKQGLKEETARTTGRPSA